MVENEQNQQLPHLKALANKQQQIKDVIKTEFLKCKNEPLYFIKKYCYIQHPVKGRIKFELYPFQEKTLDQIINNRYTIILKSRQLGISTLLSAYALHLAIFNDDKNILVLATKQKVAINIVIKLKEMYKNLPKWLISMVDVEVFNRMSVRFKNGSQIQAESAAGDAGRSEACSFCIIDESAFIGGMTEKWASIQQTLGTGGGCCMLSTPNGYGNLFHKLYIEAETGLNQFLPIKLPWTVHPDRDIEWRREQDELIGERLAAQECDVTFNSSGNTVIEPNLLQWYKETQIQNPIEKRGVNSSYWIWEHPDFTEEYLISADVARGDGADFSAAHVIKLSTMEQVAEFKDRVPTKDFGHILVTMATEYNSAYLSVENASIGWNVLQTIVDLNYPNIHYTTKADNGATSVDTYITKGYDFKDTADLVPGFTTSSRTRPLIINNLESLMREKQLKIKSQRLWDELSVFVYLSGGKAAAQIGYNDDLVLALSIGLWLRETAIRFKKESIKHTNSQLELIANNVKQTYETGVYSSSGVNKNPWKFSQGKQNIDLTQFI